MNVRARGRAAAALNRAACAVERRWTDLRVVALSNPFGVGAGAVAVVLGAGGVIIGEHVSAGMTNTLRSAAPYLGHAWGLLLAAGGIGYLVGVFAQKPSIELPAVGLMCFGFCFYLLTVTVGLQLGGFAAGTLAGGSALGCLLRLAAIKLQVRRLKAREARDAARATGGAP